MDYLNLHRDYGVTLQFGGSDQWGNITAGVELIRRTDGDHVHALATPLLTRSDGTKYGKTEGGALWLDPEMLSPYAFYQFWLNAEDDEGRRAAAGLHVPRPRRDRGPGGADRGEAVPARRPARPRRAHDHAGARRGGDRADQGRVGGAVRRRDAARARPGDPRGGAARGRAPPRSARPTGCRRIVDLLVSSGLVEEQGRGASHGGGGRRLPQQRAGLRPGLHARRATDLLGGSWLVLRRGKKNLAGVEVVG